MMVTTEKWPCYGRHEFVGVCPIANEACERTHVCNCTPETVLQAASVEKQSRETVSRPLCSTCRFWQRGEGPLLDGGACHIRAPGEEGFPISFAEDWCGEHKALPLPSRPLAYEEVIFTAYVDRSDP